MRFNILEIIRIDLIHVDIQRSMLSPHLFKKSGYVGEHAMVDALTHISRLLKSVCRIVDS